VSTIAQALANVRSTGAKVSTVVYDHEPKRPARNGGPQWHYSIAIPANVQSRPLLMVLQARTARLDLGITQAHLAVDERHLIIRSRSQVGCAAVLDIVANILRKELS
jgi:hypothetical protein